MSEVDELLMKEKQGYSDKKSKKKAKKPTWAATIAFVLSLVAGFISAFFLVPFKNILPDANDIDTAVEWLDVCKSHLIITSVLVVLAIFFLIIALSKKQQKKAVVACGLTIFLLIFSVYEVYSGISTYNESEKAIEHDAKLGADDLDDAVELCVDALRHQDVDDLEDICEENLIFHRSRIYKVNEDSFMDYSETLNDMNLNWNHYDYEVVDRYDDDDCECCTVEISIPLQGTFTDDSIMYQPHTISASFHKINSRWFFGES